MIVQMNKMHIWEVVLYENRLLWSTVEHMLVLEYF